MAIYHLEAKRITRSKCHEALKAAAYRSGQALHDKATRRTYDYSNKQGVLSCEIVTPDSAPGWMQDRERLWNEVETADKRKDAQLAKEYVLALPRELSLRQNQQLVRGWVQESFAKRGLVADISIHESVAIDGEKNPHAHVLVAPRLIDEKDFGKKCRELDTKSFLQTLRASWADAVNAALQSSGSGNKIDHRTLQDQGVERLPTRHLGKDAAALERKGQRTRKGDHNRAVGFDNRLHGFIRSADQDSDTRMEARRRKALSIIAALPPVIPPAPRAEMTLETLPLPSPDWQQKELARRTKITHRAEAETIR